MVMESLVLDKPAPGIELAVGLRTYLEIVKVEAPSEASYGTTVSINVYVKNKWTYRIFAIVTGAYDTAEVTSTSHYIDPGAQRLFVLSLTMPNKSVDLWIWAWYWTEAGWSTSPDDEYGPVKIALARWAPLDSATLTVSRAVPPVVGWQPLGTPVTIGVASAAPPVVGWQPLGTPVTVNITAGPIAPRWELIEHRDYLWAYFYDGYCEIYTAEFKLTPEQMPWTNWLAEKIGERLANRFKEAIKEYGGEMLEIDFYQDTTPIAWTNFRIVAKAGFPGKGTIGWFIPWPVIIKLIPLIITAIIGIVIYLTVCRITEGTHKHLAELEEYKKTCTRDTLASILIDHDYSAEALEGKTDAELREMVDELAPPPAAPWPWYMWLGIAGLGIAGSFVAVTALRTFAPKKK